ncbi:PDZ domain-containing protein [Amycolatopsis acidiphila]|uniref:endopeptidase La n=1 Tax=Amycolatopsis acidiphila TaxID=715473 RepID=A0A557ZVL4_9PSEU|nr:PDZ domain-containing protein [Amycolatopsis acidiphila]TVT16071.1 PDZ domain-containing protein [Amycolatopsis acidiphila]UIJ61075.1 PDZ domain-containing protein [Amycolatopsis acidiphila]
MSESREETTGRGAAPASPADPAAGEGKSAKHARRTPPPSGGKRLTRRGWTVLLSALLVIAFGLTGAFVRVPYVAIGPGPTYDTLGQAGGAPVIQISGRQTYPTAGELRMTTVSLNDQITLFGALGLWASGRYALAPREEYFKPGESDEQVQQENVQEFQDSQSNAEVAALRHLGFPIKVLAQEVVGGSPADKVLAAGDRLLNVNGKQITQEDDVRTALAGTKAGQTISITFQHGTDAPRTSTLTLAANPDSTQPQGFMGLQPIDRADVPFDVKVSLQDVGGPSAGLMFALAIVDRLTPGEMVAGEHIAGTGEIDEKGNVGPIGGISFKVVGAREAGATVFLTPEQNCAEAAAAVPNGLKLVKVTTLDSALTALDDLKAGRPTPSC